MDAKQIQSLANGALQDLKAVDIVTLDVLGMTSVTDYMVIATGTSGRHVRALADHVCEALREQGGKPLGVEGLDAAEWVLLDFGDVVVHIMQSEARRFYDLERLWSMPAARAEET